MPKVISRSVISTSNDAGGPGNSTSSSASSLQLQVLYCLCGDFALVIDRPLSMLPTRPLDGSYVLRNIDGSGGGKRKVVYKITAKQGRAVMVRRPDASLEKQYHFHCSRCDLPLGYESTPPPIKSGAFTYLFRGALSEDQRGGGRGGDNDNDDDDQ